MIHILTIYQPYTLWLFNIAMWNDPFIDDFPTRTSIYNGFSMAMLNNQRVPGSGITLSPFQAPDIAITFVSCHRNPSMEGMPRRHRWINVLTHRHRRIYIYIYNWMSHEYIYADLWWFMYEHSSENGYGSNLFSDVTLKIGWLNTKNRWNLFFGGSELWPSP